MRHTRDSSNAAKFKKNNFTTHPEHSEFLSIERQNRIVKNNVINICLLIVIHLAINKPEEHIQMIFLVKVIIVKNNCESYKIEISEVCTHGKIVMTNRVL